MKLIVQIPCHNEEACLARTIADIPREIDGIDTVEVLIVDDGSTDRTAEIAKAAGADHIRRHRRNRGLAHTFRTAIDAALQLGADVIVNTDGDNQYFGQDIPALVRPIVEGRADIVVGDRETGSLQHFSALKRGLQWLGSATVRRLSETRVPDAVSGFRAFSREAAMQIDVLSSFSYTIETIMQAGSKRLSIQAVPIRTRKTDRPSRLFRSIPDFVLNSGLTLVRIYSMYRAIRVFTALSVALFVAGTIPIARFLFAYFSDGGAGHIQSLVLGATLTLMGFVSLLHGMVADLVSFNRQLAQSTLEKVRRLEIALEQLRVDSRAQGPAAPPAGGATDE